MILTSLMLLLGYCAASVPAPAVADTCGQVGAVESVIEGLPVPLGSLLDRDTHYRGDDGVEMVSYSHPKLTGEELLAFFDLCMPGWGWEGRVEGNINRFQRTFVKDGVPVVIGADKRDTGCSFNILKGVAGDWGYMAPLRP
jgi:hypothetical protein